MHSIYDAAGAVAGRLAPGDAGKQKEIARSWLQVLAKSFIAGEFRMLAGFDRMPIDPASPGAIVGAFTSARVTLPELNRYLTVMGVGIEVTDRDFVGTPGHDDEPTLQSEHVVAAAIAFANQKACELFDKDGSILKAVGASRAIRALLNTEFKQGWSAESIRRHCLNGWKFTYSAASATAAQPEQQKNI
ncbi:hypothetical protein [Paraburkholderia tropica]|uniref:hypothetical protein n=1 Tax=Paraburkholderia tropica TaxID=92647 RepID=UPI002ABE56EC|nr:hypothetical protein [Paraburkholderia tropica]